MAVKMTGVWKCLPGIWEGKGAQEMETSLSGSAFPLTKSLGHEVFNNVSFTKELT
jgi:hypothetical protein